MYFGYGIWNSSEEYVRKGKIPPGGTQPLPQPRSSEAPAKRQLEEPISEKKLAVKVIPVTSLDDDPVGPVRLVSVQHHRQEVSPLDDTIMKLAALQAHRAAQEVFDKDRSKRQEAEEEDAKGKAQMAQAMIHAHLAADKVFQETREKRAKEEEDKKKEMILFAQQMLHAHEEADKVFQATRAKNLEANKKETGEMAEQVTTTDSVNQSILTNHIRLGSLDDASPSCGGTSLPGGSGQESSRGRRRPIDHTQAIHNPAKGDATHVRRDGGIEDQDHSHRS